MKHLTITDIQKPLETEYLGRDSQDATSRVKWSVLRLLKEFYKNTKWDIDQFSVSEDKWAVNLLYKGYEIGRVEIKRKKGRSHYSHFGTYTDYTYSGFNVWLWEDKTFNTDVESRLADIERLDAERKDAATRKLNTAKEIYKLIKEKLGTDDYGTRDFIDYMKANKYSLTE